MCPRTLTCELHILNVSVYENILKLSTSVKELLQMFIHLGQKRNGRNI